MASKFEMISAIYNDHRNEIVSSPNSWTSFLSSACHNYRLPFDELVLIYAQRPDATAVLEFDKWNKNFGRWVNAGAKGIAVFDKTPGKTQRLKHYFDISDTHETGFSRAVPVWTMKPEYDEDVIETLESTFGELKSKDTLIDAVLSAAEIATEDNISDYADVLIKFKQDSFLEELDDDSIRTIYRNTVTNSVAFVIASRLDIDTDLYFDRESFENIGNFNSDEAINAIGCATRDISEMALSEISKTVLSLEKENRTFAENDKSEYTEGVIKNERSLDYDKDNQLQKSGTGTDTELGITINEKSEARLVGRETQKVSDGERKEPLHNSADDLQVGSASSRNSGESRDNGGRPYEEDGSTGGLDRAAQGSGYDGLGTGYEQPENESSGDRSERSDLQLNEADELPPFVDEARIMAMLKNDDDSLVHRKELILQKHSELTSKQFARYVSTLYGGRLKSYNVDGIEMGYEYTTDGLLMYEGDYRNRTKESVFSWSVIGELISQLIENGEYLPPAKEEKTKPDTEQLQMGLFDLADYSFNDEVVEYEDSQTTLFPPVQIPQQIIDEAICLGTHDKESKMRISAYLRKDKPIDNNAAFIKNEYKDFASGFVFEGQKISVLADDNGLRIDNGDTARFRSSTVLSWNDVAKRTRELLDLGRYMPQFQLDKVDEFERTKLAASLIYMTRDIDEPYKDTCMPFVMDLYNTHLGFPDVEKALAEELKKPESLSMVIDDLIVYIDALEKNNKINRFPRIYKPQDLLNKLCDLQLPQLEFQAQPGVPEVPSRFISEDEITWLLRSGSTESRLWHYSLYMTEPDANKRAKEIKDRHGWSGSYTSIADISSDAKGYTLSRGKIMEPYAKITLKWSDVEKRIGKMIALDIFLTDKDKAYMPIYEKEHIANTVSYFFNVANIDCQKSFDYSSHENIMQLLDNPEAVETIYNEMLDALKDIKEDDRSYEGSHRAFEKFSQYREGTFSLFGEKKEPKPMYEQIGKDVTDENEEIAILDSILSSLKIDDILIEYSDDGLIAWDTDNEWKGAEFYHFLIDEAFVFVEEGVLGVKPDDLEAFSKYAAKYNIKVEAPPTVNTHEHTVSPMIQDYTRLAEEHPEGIVLYQVGDFYEALGDAARFIANDLDLIITSREVNPGNRIAMCGFPVKRLDEYLKKLTGFGYKVTVSGLKDNGERVETTYTIDFDKFPIGRIDYYGLNGHIREHKNYTDEQKFLEEIKSCNYAGEPISITVYTDTDGKYISTEFANDLDPLPMGFEITTYDDGMLNLAKALVNDYFADEFERYNEPDFSDLTSIGIASTDIEDENGTHSIDAFLDLVNYSVIIEIDNKVFEKRQYDSIEELIDNELYALDFNNLTHLDKYDLTRFMEEIDSIPTKEELPLADRLVAYLKNTDFYNYQDSLEIGQTDEDAVSILSEQLKYKDFCNGVIDFIKNNDTDNDTGKALVDELIAHTESLSDTNEPDLVGKELELDGRKFVIESVDSHDVHLRDITFEHQVGFPIDRAEPKERIIQLLEQAEKDKVLPPPKAAPRGRVPTFDLHPEIPMSDRNNFNLADFEVEAVGKKERFRRNMEAIRVLKECEFDNRYATPEEQKILAQYVGWGGIPEAFDEDNTAWADEYKELIVALSPDEYDRARESTLTAFYTPPVVISAMYKALEQLGFKNGNILEPSCAIGNFIGMLPESMSDSRIYGVELDNISAGIAKQLYQKSSIANMPFEEADIPDSFFDGVIGNVPFGDFKVIDKRYDKHNFLIHDYFFAKSLDKLRAGGVMLLITSKGTMDKENSNVRRYIAQRADLLGAIRLPDNTFKGNAGTEVTSDILILQKRDRIVDIEPDWVHLDTDENGIRMNKYFVDHPEMIMGDMVMQSGRFGMESTCKAYENSNLADLLEDAVSNIHGEINEAVIDDELEEDIESIPADPNVKNFSFTSVDGKIYFRENSIMKPVDASTTAENRIKGMIGIRDCVRSLIDLQRDNYPDEDIQAEQKKLNTLYDDFTKKYGLINSRANASAFSDDSSYFLLAALEVVEDGKLIRKADMFTKRTIKPHIPATHADTASEALALSIGEKAKVDIEYMQDLTGKDEDTLFNDLQGVIFLNPLKDNPNEPKYLMADEYLSGNVREKLSIAKKMTEAYPEYQANVEALEKVQPKDLTASEIEVRLGATWLPTDIVKDFMFELLEPSYYNCWYIKVHYSAHTGEWNIEGKSVDKGNLKANNTYGTSRVNAYKIIESTLNLKDVKVFDYVEDENGSRKAVLNVKETQIAQSKQELIKQAFKDWVWKDATRREKLCKLYNEKFNSIRPREYDGSHLIFHDMNSEITLRPHQLNAVAHEMYGGNTLLAHAVGAGKTMEMVAASHEGRLLGLWNKSMFVVPNHIIEQFASEYLQLYPSANILVATKKDFEKKNRKKFCAKIATGDYEAVIIGHSQFEKIPMSLERQKVILQREIDDVLEGIAELKANGGERFSIKQLERSKKSIAAKLAKLNNQERKDDVVTFEELGVDKIFVDEAHYFKNLFFYTKMNNVAGIGQSEAQKSTDLYMKCRYLDEITGGKGVVFATGTPISNSMVELYTMQRYLQYDTLMEHHLEHFDSWASTFGETTTTLELKPEGTGYKARTRFAHFYNLPELMSMFKEVADIKTADTLSLPVPNAHFNNIAVKPSELQKEMVESLSERAEKVRSGAVDPSQDNMLKITNDGRKLALDQRMINPLLPDNENSKVNACIDEVYRIWDEGKEDRLTQLIFCDLSTPKPPDENGLFTDVYNDIKNKLIAKGVPESEIAFIHNADSEAKKKDLFAKVRKGEVRVLLGSTQKMGAGTNVQDRLIAIHDIDCPWRPADLEQRAGRIIRQGNQNPDVYVNRYVTEGTFDAYLYQIIETKQKFISQIMTSKSPVRSAEDVDESSLSYAEIKMLATGNPHIKEKMDLDLKLSKLKMLKSNFLSERYALEDKVIKFYPAEIKRYEAKIKGLEADIVTAKENPKTVNDEFTGIVIFGKEYLDKKEAGLALINACKAVTSNDTIPLGEYRGFKLDLLYDSFGRQYKVNIKGAMTHTAELGTDELGNFTRMDNVIDGLEKAIVIAKDRLAETEKQFEIAKTDMKKEFPQDEELKQIEARLIELNSELRLDEKVNEVIADDIADDDEPEIKPKEQER